MNTRKYSEEEARERRNERQRDYAKRTNHAATNKAHEKTKTFLLRISFNTEKQIIDKLEKEDNKNGYIKALILKDIAENGI